MIRVYKNTLKHCKQAEPTILSQVIKQVNDYSEALSNALRYNILLILTNKDMCEEDVELTHNEIVRSSTNPVSVIIIGIDDGEFKELK